MVRTNRPRRTLTVLTGLGLAALIVVACASSGGSSLYSTGGGGSNGGASTGGGQTGVAAAASAAPTSANGQRAGSGSNSNANAAPVDETKIVRTGSLSLQVKALDAAVNSGRDLIRGIGGYVGASRQVNDGDHSTATITYRIPSARWEDALAGLRKLGSVLNEQTNAVEVTAQLIDLGARIDNLRASEKALQAIAATATKISDVLEVQSRLSEVRGQIEELDAQRAHLDDQASLGTLDVTYGLQVVAVEAASKDWNPGDEVDRASANLIGILQAITSAGIWFGIVWLPILLGLAIVTMISAFLLRRLGILRRAQPIVGPPPLSPDA